MSFRLTKGAMFKSLASHCDLINFEFLHFAFETTTYFEISHREGKWCVACILIKVVLVTVVKNPSGIMSRDY